MKIAKPLKHRYSGEKSKPFWEFVNAAKNKEELYALGVALQNLESFVLKQMDYHNANFVEKEKIK